MVLVVAAGCIYPHAVDLMSCVITITSRPSFLSIISPHTPTPPLNVSCYYVPAVAPGYLPPASHSSGSARVGAGSRAGFADLGSGSSGGYTGPSGGYSGLYGAPKRHPAASAPSSSAESDSADVSAIDGSNASAASEASGALDLSSAINEAEELVSGGPTAGREPAPASSAATSSSSGSASSGGGGSAKVSAAVGIDAPKDSHGKTRWGELFKSQKRGYSTLLPRIGGGVIVAAADGGMPICQGERFFSTSAAVHSGAASNDGLPADSAELEGSPAEEEDAPVPAPAPAERRFRAPTGRTPPAQTFADVFSTSPDAAAAPSGADAGDAPHSQPLSLLNGDAAAAAGLPSRLLMWENEPHRGDPGRSLLTLFVLSHGYVQRVPAHRLFQYEAGLYSLLSSMPSPDAGGDSNTVIGTGGRGDGAGALQRLAAARADSKSLARGIGHSTSSSSSKPYVSPLQADDDSNISSSIKLGQQRGITAIPIASYSSGYSTLLDAAVGAAVPESMITAPRLDLQTSLREANLQFIKRSSELSRAQYEARAAAEQARAAALAAEEAAKRRSKRSWFTWSSPPEVPSSPLPPPSPAPAASLLPPANASTTGAGSVDSEGALEGLSVHLRLDPGQSLDQLPLVWAAMHVAVAEYTRRFCGEPLIIGKPYK